MANQFYTLIETTELQISESLFEVKEYNLPLEDFLIQNAGKELYIYIPSITTNNIQAIVK